MESEENGSATQSEHTNRVGRVNLEAVRASDSLGWSPRAIAYAVLCLLIMLAALFIILFNAYRVL